MVSAFDTQYYLYLLYGENLDSINNYVRATSLGDEFFHKIVFIKDEIFLLCYCKNGIECRLRITEYGEDNKLYNLNTATINLELNQGGMESDIIALTEDKIAFLVPKLHGKKITIYIIDYFDNFNKI